jgi:hypothetical protein
MKKLTLTLAALLVSTTAIAMDYERIPADIESKNVREIPWALPHVHGITMPQYVIVNGKMRSTAQGPGIGRPTAASWDRFGKLEPWPDKELDRVWGGDGRLQR